jgi:16S rRNA (guanine966-N2)-methyltransferase
MRVIGGEARGRPLKAPRGLQTRPTSDLMRGAIFSMLASMDVAPHLVLDLYAGTGALGIEALSRGAEAADFVEQNNGACAVIRENLARAGFAERGRVIMRPVARALGSLRGPYDLVFADPPYADGTIATFFTMPDVGTLLGPDAVVVYEHSSKLEAPPLLGELNLIKTRAHGGSSVSFYQRGRVTMAMPGGVT